MAATRADHFRWADELVWKARRRMAAGGSDGWTPDSEYDRGNVMAWLAAAQVHATLAGVPAMVEDQVTAAEVAASRAVGVAERIYREAVADAPFVCGFAGCGSEAFTSRGDEGHRELFGHDPLPPKPDRPPTAESGVSAGPDGAR